MAADRPETGAASDPLAPLVARARTGDRAALRDLLRALGPSMIRVAHALLGRDRADADDAVQESLLGLVRALPTFRGESSITHFAGRIAVRAALLARKRRRTHEQRLSSFALEEEPTTTDPDDDAIASRRRAILRALVEELPEAQAESLTLRIVLGCSMEEVATLTGVPLNTVRSRLRLAKEVLRRKIEADETAAELLAIDGPWEGRGA